jgi:superfamily II DNA or RNA helicase
MDASPDPGPLRSALQRRVPDAVWRIGERVADAGKVAALGPAAGGERFEVQLGPARFEVHLWPRDLEWSCDCEADACAHAAAAAIAWASGRTVAAEPPPRLLARLRTAPEGLGLSFVIERGTETEEARPPFPPGVGAFEPVDRLVRLLRDQPGDRVPGRLHHVLLDALLQLDAATLDGQPVEISKVPLDVVAKVDRFGASYRLRMADDPSVTQVFPGDPDLVVAEGKLRPRGYGRLSDLERHRLGSPVLYSEAELAVLTGRRLPELEKSIRVVRAESVPATQRAGVSARVDLLPVPGGVEVHARVVYGDPPLAELRGQEAVPMRGISVLPVRDRGAEEQAARLLLDELGMRSQERRLLQGGDAAVFLDTRLRTFSGTVGGAEHGAPFAIRGEPPRAELSIRRGGAHVAFRAGDALLSAGRVLDAWRSGNGLVGLPGGGFAPLPIEWLSAHGETLESLVDAEAGSPQAALASVELLQAHHEEVPERLAQLGAALLRHRSAPLPPPDGLTATLRPYQVEGQSFLRALAAEGLGCVLADDMGLGKTVQALAALLDRTSGPSLVVAPTSVLRNWLDEAARFAPSLRVGLLHGPRRDEVWAARTDHDLLVTSYALLRLDADTFAAQDWDLVLLDEAQAIKNADSATARSARRLRANARVALTGTPVENRLHELWSLFEFLNPSFFGPKARFDERFGIPAERGDERARASLRRRIAPLLLRRLKADVARDLPPRTEIVLRCPMSPAQRAAYDKARTVGRRKLSTDGKPKRIAILEVLTRLRQASCHPGLLPGGDPLAESGKLDVLMEHLGEAIDEGHKALVFSQWTSLLDRIEDRLRASGQSFLRLDGSTRDRAGLVARFQEPSGPPLFLISLKAGGTGLNLTAADHVFHVDPWWNPASEDQATDRAHRIGQQKPVLAWKLVSEGTVEEAILDLQAKKRALAGSVLEGGGAPALSDDELMALLEEGA